MEQDKNNKESVVICVEDLECIEKFFEHFSMPMPDYLKIALATFRNKQNIDTQNLIKLELTKAFSDQNIVGSLDSMFEPVIEAARETSYKMQFDKDFEEIIGKKDDKKNGDKS